MLDPISTRLNRQSPSNRPYLRVWQQCEPIPNQPYSSRTTHKMTKTVVTGQAVPASKRSPPSNPILRSTQHPHHKTSPDQTQPSPPRRLARPTPRARDMERHPTLHPFTPRSPRRPRLFSRMPQRQQLLIAMDSVEASNRGFSPPQQIPTPARAFYQCQARAKRTNAQHRPHLRPGKSRAVRVTLHSRKLFLPLKLQIVKDRLHPRQSRPRSNPPQNVSCDGLYLRQTPRRSSVISPMPHQYRKSVRRRLLRRR